MSLGGNLRLGGMVHAKLCGMTRDKREPIEDTRHVPPPPKETEGHRPDSEGSARDRDRKELVRAEQERFKREIEYQDDRRREPSPSEREPAPFTDESWREDRYR